MTNDQIWHQSTVFERTEILKARLDRMEVGPVLCDPLELERLRKVKHAVLDFFEEWRGPDDEERARRVREALMVLWELVK